jgi:hypothetical protein
MSANPFGSCSGSDRVAKWPHASINSTIQPSIELEGTSDRYASFGPQPPFRVVFPAVDPSVDVAVRIAKAPKQLAKEDVAEP